MDTSQLKKDFPGLFVEHVCRTVSEAEQYADEVAVSAGLTVRTSHWESGAHHRTLQYEDPSHRLRLSVRLSFETAASSRATWSFQCWADRLDVNLRIKPALSKRARPETFQQDVKSLVQQLRSVHIEPPSRAVGWLKKWDAVKGHGVIQCVPGATVYVDLQDLPPPARGKLHFMDCLSFEVRQAAHSQKAIAVRRYVPLCDSSQTQ